jgi:hypothetical protein
MNPDEMRILRDAERKLVQTELRYLGAAKTSANMVNSKKWRDFERAKSEYLLLMKKFGANQEEAISSLTDVSNIV